MTTEGSAPESAKYVRKRTHVAVHLDPKDVERLDRYADKTSRSRSSAGVYLIITALRMFEDERG